MRKSSKRALVHPELFRKCRMSWMKNHSEFHDENIFMQSSMNVLQGFTFNDNHEKIL